jgi:hypothetical protein
MTMQLISTTTLSSSAANVTFSSIPQTGTDLIVRISERNDQTTYEGRLTINGAVFTLTGAQSTGSGQNFLQPNSQEIEAFTTNVSSQTADCFSNTVLCFPNYTSTTTKVFYAEGGSSNYGTDTLRTNVIAGTQSSSSPITTLVFRPNSGNFVAKTKISLYSVLKGSGGATAS